MIQRWHAMEDWNPDLWIKLFNLAPKKTFFYSLTLFMLGNFECFILLFLYADFFLKKKIIYLCKETHASNVFYIIHIPTRFAILYLTFHIKAGFQTVLLLLIHWHPHKCLVHSLDLQLSWWGRESWLLYFNCLTVSILLLFLTVPWIGLHA